MADNRTVLHALPEDQPDSLGIGTKSNSVHGEGSDNPSSSDTKAVWESYAASQGVDTDGMTKADIVDALS